MQIARNIAAVVAIGFLAGCVQPKLDTAEDSSLNVTAVDVTLAGEAAQGGTVVSGRQAAIGQAQLVADLETELRGALQEASNPEGTPAAVLVTVSQVYLAPAVERVVAGTSYIQGSVRVTGEDGRTIVRPTAIRGNTDNIRLAGAFGLATTRSVENDYRGTLRGFAKTVRNALFGAPDA